MSTAADKMTAEIIGAWDEIRDEDEPAETVEPADTPATEEAEDETVPAEVEETEEEEVSTPEEEEAPEEEEESETEPETPSGDEEEEVSADVSDDPLIQGFLSRHGGTVETALADGARLESVVGRQGRELGQWKARAAELEAQLEQVTAFAPDGRFLNSEQQEWVESAVSAENALPYIQDAVNQGEFDLARAVIDQGQFPVGQALRLAQAIDQAERQAYEPDVPDGPLDHNILLNLLTEHYPDMPRFEQDMIGALRTLGPSHPLVIASQSQDPKEAAQGVIGLYEIARAKSATVASTREEVKQKKRQAATAARDGAVVSSGSATPPQAPVARTRPLMPGLTLEALEAEFEND